MLKAQLLAILGGLSPRERREIVRQLKQVIGIVRAGRRNSSAKYQKQIAKLVPAKYSALNN